MLLRGLKMLGGVVLEWQQHAMNTLVQTPDFLRNALGLQDATMPRALYLGAILPTVDVLQGGWKNNTPAWMQSALTNALQAEALVEAGAFPNHQHLIIGLDATSASGATVPAVVSVSMVSPNNQATRVWHHEDPAADRLFSTHETLPGGPQLVPAGWGITTAFVPTDVLNTATLTLVVVRLPAGCKVR